MEMDQYNTRARLINELTQGLDLARQLRAQMGPEYSPQTKQALLEQIISSYDKALLILRCGAPPELGLLASSPLLPSSPSCNTPPQGSLKRKSASTWTNRVKLNLEDGLEDGPPYDGYNWRKYGQKDILGAKYPRSYYRCTYRSVQDCWAVKQVQRSDEDPTVVDITYRGKHTCNEVRRSKSAPTATLPVAVKQEHHSTEEYQHMDFLKIESPTFYANFPTSDSNYFCTSAKMDVQHQQHYFEGGIGDIVLRATSSTNNPGIPLAHMEPEFHHKSI